MARSAAAAAAARCRQDRRILLLPRPIHGLLGSGAIRPDVAQMDEGDQEGVGMGLVSCVVVGSKTRANFQKRKVVCVYPSS